MIGQRRNVTKKMKRETMNKILVFCGLVVLGVATRWISDAFKPNLSNVTATVAAALFAGFYLSPRWTACLVPVAIVLISNFGLPNYNTRTEMAVSIAMLVLPVALGWRLQRKSSTLRILAFAATPSVLFYLVTDCVYWSGFDLWPKTISGQIDSYIAALPFLRNMLLGDLFFTGIFFGAYWLVVSKCVPLSRQRVEAAVVAE